MGQEADTHTPKRDRQRRRGKRSGQGSNPNRFERELRNAITSQAMVQMWTIEEEDPFYCHISFVDQYFIKVQVTDPEISGGPEYDWVNKAHIIRLRISKNGGG